MEEIQKAIRQMEAHQTEDAIKTLTQYLPEADEEERFTIAELYMQWGMLEEAKMVLHELIQRYPKEQELKVMMAEIHIDLDEDDEAIELLDQFGPEDEDYLQALVQLADLYQAQGLYEVAEQKLLLAKQVEPNSAIIDFALGELAFSNGEYSKSIPYYENAMHHQPVIGDIEVATRLAEAYAANGEFEQSLEFFQKVEEDNPDVMFRYGFVAFQANRNDIAIHVWEELIEKDPYFQSVYPHLAQAYDSEGMPKEALEMAKKGLAKDEFNKELYHLAGTLSHKQGNKEEGYELMREAVALDPGYKEAVLFLIENYKADDLNENIIDLIHELLALGEEDPHYLWELAQAYEEEEKFTEAYEQYKQAYPSLKEDTDFLKSFGYFLVEEGKMSEARQTFEEYLTIDPSDTEIEDFVERLKEQ
ncbi:Tetratricopeptide repeat-containing protein [Halobacillus karajensis]|uniref:Tetratricopeptide repeat protein n=1 Tax=Halobacillus karajensis TaxID=195088 RepID=A0A024P138_9BACI|nr:tetratricopeptide repeat protein [Halobacillus karajensis]CDQ19507.1 tetratricopeptide repeat protein [Halobacillus karajensis]CDQ21969.1 tetratricopeptide repeat protein [Halobacillus karajensis]CDQ27810.1 tetratricopeptide repeat protein [Halobacillus karajensis]SEH81221.1 Tetratricopeptide repeat-containing protein [Halobacillus karajensis]